VGTITSPQMSRTKSAAIQLSGAMALMLLSTVQGLLLIPLYLHYIGGYLYGAWLALAGSVVLFGMADMGISSLVIQKSAVFYSEKDYVALARLVGTMRVVNILAIAMMVIVAAITIPAIPRWLNILPQYHSILTVVAWLTVLEVGLMLLVNVSGSFLFGVQNPGPHMIASIAGALSSIIVIVLLLVSGFGVLAISLGALARPILIIPINSYFVKTFLSSNEVSSEVKAEKKMFLDLLSNSLWLGPSKIAETLSGQIDSIIVAKVLGVGAVTVLSITRKAADLSVQIAGKIPGCLLSGLSHLHGAGQKDIQQQVVQTLFKVVGYFGAIGLGGVLIFNEKFVSLWAGSQYYAGNLVTGLVCLYSILKLLQISMYNIVFSIGEITLSAKSSIAGVVLQAVLGFLFSIKMGLPGLVIGAIVGIMSSTVIQFGKMFAANVIGRNEFMLLCFKLSGLIGCFMLSAYLINMNVCVVGWFELIVGIAVYLIMSLSIAFVMERKLSSQLSNVLLNQLRGAIQRV